MKSVFKGYLFFLFVLFSAVVLASMIRWLFYGTTVWEILFMMGLLAIIVLPTSLLVVSFLVAMFYRYLEVVIEEGSQRHHSQC